MRQSNMTQSEIILEFFESHPHRAYTPFEVREACGLSAPITSVRRAMTNLTQDGELRKLRDRRDGPYGVRNRCWAYDLGQWEC